MADVRAHRQPGELESWGVSPALESLYGVYARALNLGVLERCLASLDALTSARGDRDEIASLAPVVRGSRWTTPDLSFAYHIGLSTGTADRARCAAVVDQLVALEEPTPPSRRFVVDADAPWIAFALERFAADERNEGGDKLMASVQGQARDFAHLDAAFALLTEAWPEMAFEVDLLVRDYVWSAMVRGVGTPVGSLVQAFGAVFLPCGVGRLGLLEALVHETTHLDVTMRLALDNLVLNRETIGSSPVRDHDRPLTRILHVAMVSSRVHHALQRCRELLLDGELADCGARQQEAARQLVHSLETLNERAEWTSTGARLAQSLNDYAATEIDAP